jgi:hypothetical protein
MLATPTSSASRPTAPPASTADRMACDSRWRTARPHHARSGREWAARESGSRQIRMLDLARSHRNGTLSSTGTNTP